MDREEIEERVKTPDHFYTSAALVLEDDALVAEEKLRVLRSMQVDAERLSASTAENMGGGEEAPSLAEIRRAIGVLEESRRHGAPL